MDTQIKERKMHKLIAHALLLLMLWLGGAAYAGTVTYIYTDAQGTPLAEADANGNITARFDYTPYGVSVPSMDPAPNGPGYTGHVNDPDTGLVYMQARYYDPAIGRFLSVDPVEPSPGNTFNFNRYNYANNNPYKFIDPDGRLSSLKDHPSLNGSVRTYLLTTSASTSSGSVVETRHAISTFGVAKEGSIVEAGKIERLPQRSANGVPAKVGDKVKSRLFNFSEKAGRIIEITSGQRTVEQNRVVGGAARSQHLQDNAADIRINGNTPAQTADAAHVSGEFNRVNEYSNGRGVHVDLRQDGIQGRLYDWRPQE